MSFGGGSPYPRKLGGGRPRVRDLRDAIGQDRGDAYTTEPGTIVFAENSALARAINSGWGTNTRLGNLWNPLRCDPQTLSRWEAILAIPVSTKDSIIDRRNKVAKVLTFKAEGLRGNLLSELAVLGQYVVDIEYLNIANATVYSPDNTYPFGTQNPTVPWASTAASVIVRLQKPANTTEADFYKAVAKALAVLDPYLPVWVTFDWYRAGPVSSASGGLSGVGFYLDDEANFDNQLLD